MKINFLYKIYKIYKIYRIYKILPPQFSVLLSCFFSLAISASWAQLPGASEETSALCSNLHTPATYRTAEITDAFPYSRRVDYYKSLIPQITDFKKFAFERYGREGWIIYTKLKNLHPHFLQLIVDPGLAFHVDEFLQFVAGQIPSSQAFSPEDPWAVREQFKEFLGFSQWYRVMALRPEEAEEIEKRGIQSRFIRHQKGDHFALSLQEQYDYHIYQPTLSPKDPFLSVTQHPSLGFHVTRPYKTKNNFYYVYTLKIPKLDMIYPVHSSSQRKAILHSDEALFHPKLESFLPFFIEKEEIQRAEKVGPFSLKYQLMSKFSPFRYDCLSPASCRSSPIPPVQNIRVSPEENIWRKKIFRQEFSLHPDLSRELKHSAQKMFKKLRDFNRQAQAHNVSLRFTLPTPEEQAKIEGDIYFFFQSLKKYDQLSKEFGYGQVFDSLFRNFSDEMLRFSPY